MILLLGKNDVIDEYLDSIVYTEDDKKIKVDIEKDTVYCPSILSHYTEYGQYIDIIKAKHPAFIITQSLEMIDVLLESDLNFMVVTVIRHNGRIMAASYLKDTVLADRKAFNFDPRG